ncbi:MAG TPA: O-antigen ligase family protein [Solirubrobacteraceae bacterium]|nr:O-antigen ligase family protein [Solirubrobacteraceae bacterium]
MVAAPTESAPPAGAAPALGVAPPLTPARRTIRRRVPAGAGGLRGGGMWPWLVGFAGLLCLLSFYAKGGLDLETTTASEIGLTVLATVVLAAGALKLRRGSPTDGLGPSLLLLAFALLSAVSIVWSVQPDNSWRDAARLIAYAFVFGAAAILARLGTRRWPALLGGIALASTIVCGFALLTKSLPNHFEEANRYARLYEPYGYWNALGLTAAMGAVCCLWLGARRAGHAVLSALSYPAMGVLLLTLLLAYSRGALVALAVALVAWFAFVPLRLRGAAVLLSGAVAAGAIAAWDFKSNALSSETATIAEKTTAGHELGALVIAMVALLTIVGVAVVFATGRRPPTARSRRHAGTALLALIAVLIVAFAGALAASHRGFTGSISHTWNTLTDTHAKLPSNSPDRLTAVASVRAQYWDEALKVFKAHPALGVGADGYEVARLRYRTGPLVVKHAHGFIVQTLADLGLVGLALTILLLLSWMAAAGRATHPFNRRWRSWSEIRGGARPSWMRLTAEQPGRYGPERIGLLSMTCVVLLFGVHSLIDWTWYVPGNAIAALLCAGWVAGRGPLRPVHADVAPAGANGAGANGAGAMTGRASPSPWAKLIPEGRAGSVRIAAAVVVVIGAALAIWFESQPQRSEDSREQALGRLASDPRGALAAGQQAVSRDPLSVEALFALAYVQNTEGQTRGARATLRKAVRLQPSNPKTWLTLGRFDLTGDPQAALQELRAAFYLDPLSISSEALAAGQPEAIQDYNDYVQALRAVAQQEKTLKTENERHSRAAAARHAARRSARRSPRSRSRTAKP